MKILENILYPLVLIVMLLPALQKELEFIPEKELNGDFVPAEKPVFTWLGWYRGEYQAQLDGFLNDHIGFNPNLIRLNNQIDYSLFNYIHADGVVKGKGGQLFEYDYIRSYLGIDYLGEKYIDKKIRRMKFVQDFLKDSLDIDLLFVLEPGKASFYPEYIPDRYMKYRSSVSNYTTILEKAQHYGVKYLDLNAWFRQLKNKVAYPMYGQFGTHWSPYGMSFAADTLLRLIEKTRGIHMREAVVDSFEVEPLARVPDYDIATAMNLICRLKDREPLAYPVYRFGERSDTLDYPMVLVVGDSYFWNIINPGIPKEVFGNEAYWYFGHLVYPDFYYKPTYVTDLDLKEEVEKQDVILLMTTERFLYKFDWKFVDNLYALYGVTSEYDKVFEYQSQILMNNEWVASIISKARLRNIPVEEMLYLDAKYIYKEQEPDNYAVYYGIADQEEQIRKDPAWMSKIEEKAKEKNISLDEMIRIDAEYMLSTAKPEAYAIYKQIEQNKEMLLKDSIRMEQIRKAAGYYRIDTEEMLYLEAERMSRNKPTPIL